MVLPRKNWPRFPAGRDCFPAGRCFPKSGWHFPKDGGRFPKSGRDFPKDGGRFPKDEDRFPKDGRRFPKSDDGFPKDGDYFLKSKRGFPDGKAGVPAGNCDFLLETATFPKKAKTGFTAFLLVVVCATTQEENSHANLRPLVSATGQ